MRNIHELIATYLDYCKEQKKLSPHTLRAYAIDLRQFEAFLRGTNYRINKENLSDYVKSLHHRAKPKTVKRKIASVKAFFEHLHYEGTLEENPIIKLRVKFKEPILLPKTIPLNTIGDILKTVYSLYQQDSLSAYRKRFTLRDICVLEFLFITGVRVSELSYLKPEHIDFKNGIVHILGKGSKERRLTIGNEDILVLLSTYKKEFCEEISRAEYLFVNRLGNRLSEQSIRLMVNKYVTMAGLPLHITPHMFRHSFATLLLEENVDIRYIQNFLGHSSITTTQIYTHVTSAKQRHILTEKHPRNKLDINFF